MLQIGGHYILSKIKKLNGIVAMASNLGELESYWDLLEKYKKLKADYESEQKLRKEYQIS